MSISSITPSLVDVDFLIKVDNIIGKGSKYEADTSPISPLDENFARLSPSKLSRLERLSRWANRKFHSLAEAHTAQKIGNFIQNQIFRINWGYLSSRDQLDRIYGLEKAILHLQEKTDKRLQTLEGKRVAIEHMNAFKRLFYTKPSSEEIRAYRGASATLSEALKTLKGLEESAQHQKMLESPVAVVPLSSKERDVHELFKADSAFKKHMDFADYLLTKKISTTPFLAMVRQLESQPYGRDIAAPLRAKLSTLSDIESSEEDFLGVLDQEEIKKFNLACISYLKNRFGSHLVNSIIDQKEMSPFTNGTFTISEGLTYSVITGIIFHRLVMSLEKMKREEGAKKADLLKKSKELETASMTSDSTDTASLDSRNSEEPPIQIIKPQPLFSCRDLGISWKCPVLGIKKAYDSLRQEAGERKFKPILDLGEET